LASAIDPYLSADPALAARQRDWIGSIEPLTLVCRARMRHDFPELDPSSPDVPEGMRVALQRDGSYVITSFCKRCGRKRVEVTAPGGGWDGTAPKMTYKEPAGYAAPRGLGLRGNAAYKARHGEVRAETFRDAQLLARRRAERAATMTVHVTTSGDGNAES
jgi:hypothetical protein